MILLFDYFWLGQGQTECVFSCEYVMWLCACVVFMLPPPGASRRHRSRPHRFLSSEWAAFSVMMVSAPECYNFPFKLAVEIFIYYHWYFYYLHITHLSFLSRKITPWALYMREKCYIGESSPTTSVVDSPWPPTPPFSPLCSPSWVLFVVLSLNLGLLHVVQHRRRSCQRRYLFGKDGTTRVKWSPKGSSKCKYFGRGVRPWCVSVGQRILRHYQVHDFRPRWAYVRTKLLSTRDRKGQVIQQGWRTEISGRVSASASQLWPAMCGGADGVNLRHWQSCFSGMPLHFLAVVEEAEGEAAAAHGCHANYEW